MLLANLLPSPGSRRSSGLTAAMLALACAAHLAASKPLHRSCITFAAVRRIFNHAQDDVIYHFVPEGFQSELCGPCVGYITVSDSSTTAVSHPGDDGGLSRGPLPPGEEGVSLIHNLKRLYDVVPGP